MLDLLANSSAIGFVTKIYCRGDSLEPLTKNGKTILVRAMQEMYSTASSSIKTISNMAMIYLHTLLTAGPNTLDSID